MSRPRRVLTEEERQLLVGYVNGEYQAKDLYEKFKVKASSFHRLLQKNGIRKNRIRPPQIKKSVKYIVESDGKRYEFKTCEATANKIGCSSETIRRYLKLNKCRMFEELGIHVTKEVIVIEQNRD